MRADLDGGSGGTAQQFLNDRELKAREKIERCLRRGGAQFFERRTHELAARIDFSLHVALPGPAQNGGFVAAEAEIEIVSFHLRDGEFDGVRIAEGSQVIDDRTAGITKAEKLGDFVVGFAGSVVASFAEETVFADGEHFKQMRVAAARDESDSGKGNFGMFKQDGVNVSFHVMDCNEREPASKA